MFFYFYLFLRIIKVYFKAIIYQCLKFLVFSKFQVQARKFLIKTILFLLAVYYIRFVGLYFIYIKSYLLFHGLIYYFNPFLINTQFINLIIN